MVGIYGPDGRLIPRTVCYSRKAARRNMAKANGCKWHDLWEIGFRVRQILTAKQPV